MSVEVLHKSKPILCLDFDGVMHSYTSGWKGVDVIPDPPVKDLMHYLELYASHFTVVVYSSRSKEQTGINAMRSWLIKWWVDWCEELRQEPFSDSHDPAPWPNVVLAGGQRKPFEIFFTHEKPAAFLTIDDRGWQFNGAWPAVDDLIAFRPWYLRGGEVSEAFSSSTPTGRLLFEVLRQLTHNHTELEKILSTQQDLDAKIATVATDLATGFSTVTQAIKDKLAGIPAGTPAPDFTTEIAQLDQLDQAAQTFVSQVETTLNPPATPPATTPAPSTGTDTTGGATTGPAASGTGIVGPGVVDPAPSIVDSTATAATGVPSV
jgi:hypothetical protein